MKSFEEKMEYIKDFLFDVMKPSIREWLHMINPDELEKWQGNCCRQTSLITNWFLREWLINEEAGYTDIQSWVGEFTDVEKGKNVRYDHAWIYCVNKDPQRNLMVDIARNHRPLVFEFTPVNKYDRTWPGYAYMRRLKKSRLNEKEMWSHTEYFTQKTIKELLPAFTRYLRSQGVMKQKAVTASVRELSGTLVA